MLSKEAFYETKLSLMLAGIFFGFQKQKL